MTSPEKFTSNGVEFTMSADTAAKIRRGELQPHIAFLTGLLEIDGDVTDLIDNVTALNAELAARNGTSNA